MLLIRRTAGSLYLGCSFQILSVVHNSSGKLSSGRRTHVRLSFSQNCVEAAAADDTADCTWAKDGDNSWSTSEEITISEGANNDLCDGTGGGCDMTVTLTKVGVGNEDDKVIREVAAYADANN